VKKQTTLRDNIYSHMDLLVDHADSINKKLPAITLDSAQFQIFKDFNKPVNGVFHYRGVEVKG